METFATNSVNPTHTLALSNMSSDNNSKSQYEAYIDRLSEIAGNHLCKILSLISSHLIQSLYLKILGNRRARKTSTNLLLYYL